MSSSDEIAINNIAEINVAITDYTLALQAFIIIIYINKQPSKHLIWLSLFISILVASLLGGTVHGFFRNELSYYHQTLWKLTLLSVSCMTFCMWHVNNIFIENSAIKKTISIFTIFQFIINNMVIIFFSSDFSLVALNYLPAITALFIVFIKEYISQKNRIFIAGITSIFLTFIGFFVQFKKISLSYYFNHNTIYHIIQLVAIYLLFKVTKWDIRRKQNG